MVLSLALNSVKNNRSGAPGVKIILKFLTLKIRLVRLVIELLKAMNSKRAAAVQ